MIYSGPVVYLSGISGTNPVLPGAPRESGSKGGTKRMVKDKLPQDPRDEGWAFARDTKFTKAVLSNRVDRQKFKEAHQQALLDRTRSVSDEKLEEFERVSLQDNLTELYNTKTFLRKLEYELRRAKRYKRPLSLLVMNIDGLQGIGRQYGALTIDDILKASADIIRGAIRDVDIAGRCSHDQLGVIFPETYSSRAVVVAERIRERLKAQPINYELRNLRVTASVGVVSFPTHARDEADLMEKCLEFLSTASQQGGDQVFNG